MNQIFKNYKPSITIEELDTIDTSEFFKKKTLKLSEESSKILVDYYNKERRNRYGYIGFYQQSIHTNITKLMMNGNVR